MLGLCQPVIDIVEGAGIFEGMRVEEPPAGDHLLDLGWVLEVSPAGSVKWVPLSVRTCGTL